jgi:chemotaxis protein histidine kinase CheA
VLGDGNVALILDVQGLIDAATIKRRKVQTLLT